MEETKLENEEKKEVEKTNKQPEVSKKKKPKVNKEMEALKATNLEQQEKILRISAEMQNMRRRYEEEIARIRKYEGDELMKQILPILDNFERALQFEDNVTEEFEKFLSGFKMVYTNLLSILEEKEVKEIICKEKEFDPSKMEAVLTEHVEGLEKNIVVDVLQKGYMYKDKLLRPAMVKVSE